MLKASGTGREGSWAHPWTWSSPAQLRPKRATTNGSFVIYGERVIAVPTNHENITCGRHCREKPKDKLPVGTRFTSCKRQGEIFLTHTNQMFEYWEACLKDRTEAELSPSYPQTNANRNLFFLVACSASFTNTEFTLAESEHGNMK